MPVDGPPEPDGDDPGRHGDHKPDESPDRGGGGGRRTGVSTRLTETRNRAEYYDALRAADGYPATEDEPKPPMPGADVPRSGWETPELADHPDRPPAESFRVPPERAAHILDGDVTGGGHRHGTGQAGKTEFPADWDDKKIMDSILGVARSPDSAELQRNGRWRAEGSHDGVKVAIVVLPDGRIWTAYPLPGSPGVTQNPRSR